MHKHILIVFVIWTKYEKNYSWFELMPMCLIETNYTEDNYEPI